MCIVHIEHVDRIIALGEVGSGLVINKVLVFGQVYIEMRFQEPRLVASHTLSSLYMSIIADYIV
jgi:hypothetical protein